MADSYFPKRFRDSRKVYDWLDQFTDQSARMGLIGPDKDRLSFKRELLSIIMIININLSQPKVYYQ